MKRKILSIMVIILCLSLTMSGCVFVDAIKGLAYNTETQEGYTEVIFSNTRLEVPTDIKNEAIEPVGTITMSSKEVLETTYETYVDSYALLNCSKIMVLVNAIDFSQDLSDLDDSDDFERALKIQENPLIDLDIDGSFATTSINGQDKVIAGAKGVLNSDFGTYNFTGYVTAIENSKSDAYVLTVLSTDDSIDTEYIAKSFDFTEKSNNQNNKPTTSVKDENTSGTVSNDTDIQEPSNSQSNSNISSSKLDDFAFSLNGKSITLPVSTKEFLSTFDLEITDNNKNYVMKSGEIYYTHVTKGEESFMVGVYNPMKNNAPITDSEIFCIDISDYNVKTFDGKLVFDFILPNEIRPFGANYQDLISKYGNPTKDIDVKEYFTRTLTWELFENEKDFLSGLEVMIDTETNVITNFTYTHFPYDFYTFA